jgi:hypothetical protein
LLPLKDGQRGRSIGEASGIAFPGGGGWRGQWDSISLAREGGERRRLCEGALVN